MSKKIMVQKLFIICVCLTAVCGSVFADAIEPNWVARHNGSANNSDYTSDIAVDSNGNVVVSGYVKTINSNYDFATIKYSPQGSVLWTRIFNRNNTDNDYAMACAIDSNNNVFSAGYSYLSTTGYDGVIVKYNPAGTLLWSKSYDLTINDRFYDAATDASGNIYAVGKANEDCLIIKCGPDSSTVWTRIYNGPANGFDALYKIAVDDAGNVYACGESEGICLVMKYSADGTMLWAKNFDGGVYQSGWLADIAVDFSGNAYATGSVGTATDLEYITIKYASDGTMLWATSFGLEFADDEAYAIALCADGNAVVTGYSAIAGDTDAVTIKYNSETGGEMWTEFYDGQSSGDDFGAAIATDALGFIYVHGASVENTTSDYLTICYDTDGAMQWQTNYDGPAGLSDIGQAMAFDDGKLYVTGYSQSAASNYDFATLKYTLYEAVPPEPCPQAPAGDLNGDCKVNFNDIVVFADGFTGVQSDYLTLEDIADTWLDCGLSNQGDCWPIE